MQTTFAFFAPVLALPAPAAITQEWSFCDTYCHGPIHSYTLTLFVGQAREWCDGSPYRFCSSCAAKTKTLGNRLILISQ